MCSRTLAAALALAALVFIGGCSCKHGLCRSNCPPPSTPCCPQTATPLVPGPPVPAQTFNTVPPAYNPNP